MLSLFRYELYKLISKRVFLLVTVLVVGLVSAPVFIRTGENPEAPDRELYYNKRAYYCTMTKEEASEQLKKEIDACVFVQECMYARENDISIDLIGMIYEEMLERYQTTAESLLEEYVFFLDFSKEEQDDYLYVLRTLQEQYIYSDTFRDYQKGMKERGERLLKIAAFANEKSFAYRSIIKSLKDYEKLGTVEIQPDYDAGIRRITEKDYTALFCMILVLAAAAILYTEENDTGMSKLINTAMYGRSWLAFAKLMALFLYASTITLVTQAFRIITIGVRIGYGDLSRAIQSVSQFRDCCYRISIRDYLILQTLLPLLAVLFFAALSALFFRLFRRAVIPSSILIIYGGASLFLSRLIPDNSLWNTLKYCNPAALLNPAARFGTYTRVNVFGFPVSFFSACFLFLAIFASAALLFYFWISSTGTAPVFRGTCHKKRIHIRGTSLLFLQENYRLLVVFGGALLLAVIVLFVAMETKTDRFTMPEDVYYYYDYGQEISGRPIGQEVLQWIDEKEAELVLTPQSVDNWYLSDPSVPKKKKALAQIRSELYSLMQAHGRGIQVHYISSTLTDPIYGSRRMLLTAHAVLLLLTMFCLSPMFSQDTDTGLYALVASAKNGQLKLILYRYGAMLLWYTLVFVLLAVPYLYNWVHYYGMKDFDAPIQSIVEFSSCSGQVSVRTFSLMWLFSSYLSGITMIFLGAFLSVNVRKKSTTLIVTMLLIMADHLIGFFSPPILRSIVISSGVQLPEIFIESRQLGVAVLVMIKTLLFAAGILLGHVMIYLKTIERLRYRIRLEKRRGYA